MVKNLALLIPCYNPRKNWEVAFVSKVKELEKTLSEWNIHVIICNDGSDFHFGEAESEYLKQNLNQITLLHHPKNQGKGAALRNCLKNSTGSYYIYTDSDFPFTMQSLAAMVHCLESGADIVVGKRKNYFTHLTPTRKAISKTAMLLNQYVLRIPHADTQGGLKGFNENGKKVFLQTRINGFLFDTEFIKLGVKSKNIRMEVVEIETRSDVHFSNFKLRTLMRESINFITLLIR